MTGQKVSDTWIKVGVSLISSLLAIVAGLLVFLWQGQVAAVEKIDEAINLVENRVTLLERNSTGNTTNIKHIQEDIREIKLDVRALRGH